MDLAQIHYAIRSSLPVTIRSYYLTSDTEMEIDNILSLYLKELNIPNLKNTMYYCIRELYMNARKAYIKRLFFIENGLNIHDRNDYEEGMKTFKNELIDNYHYYLAQQKETPFYIKIIFQIKNNKLQICVVNNSKMTIFEQKRMYDRIAQSHSFNSIDEALSTTIDNAEGAGLGLTIISLLLKNSGIDKNNFEIDLTPNETIVKMTVPCDAQYTQNIQETTHKISEELYNIYPTFSLEHILEHESRNISNILNLFDSNAVINSLIHSNFHTEQIWNHSVQTAQYARVISQKLLNRDDLVHKVCVSALLHDLGKILWSANDSQFIRKQIPSQLLPTYNTYLEHAEIAASLAQKWRLPQFIIQSIRHHHNPTYSDPEYHPIVYIVYFANILVNIDNSLADYDQIDPQVLSAFNIYSTDSLNKLHALLQNHINSETTAHDPSN